MIEIGQNPNTKQSSVAIVMQSYFGIGRDGIKLVDSDKVFDIDSVKKVAEIPSDAFDMCQREIKITDKKQTNKPWLFQAGKSGNPYGRPKGTTKTPITDMVEEVLYNKHYDKKDGKQVRALELYAESLVDRAILQGNGKAIDTVYERIEGEVTQSVKLSGAITHDSLPPEALERLAKIFPDTK